MENNSQNRLRRIAAVISLVFVVLGFGFMVAALIVQGELRTVLGSVSLACYAVGIAIFAVLYVKGAFPQKQAKEKEKRDLEAAYYNKLREQEAEKEAASEAETTQKETDEKVTEEKVTTEKVTKEE